RARAAATHRRARQAVASESHGMDALDPRMPESHRRKCPDWFRGKHSCHTSEPATAAQLPADGACSARLSRPRVRTQHTTEPAAPRNGYSGVAAVRTRRATLMYPLSAPEYNVVLAQSVSITSRDRWLSDRTQ